jgi:hypothetical protein
MLGDAAGELTKRVRRTTAAIMVVSRSVEALGVDEIGIDNGGKQHAGGNMELKAESPVTVGRMLSDRWGLQLDRQHDFLLPCVAGINSLA